MVASPLDKAHLPPPEQRELRYLGEASTVLGIVRQSDMFLTPLVWGLSACHLLSPTFPPG